ARFADLSLDEPTVAQVLGTAPTIVGRLATSPAGLEIHALRMEGVGATATADGTAALDGRSLDVTLAAELADIAPVAHSLGAAAAGRGAAAGGGLAANMHLTRTAADPSVRFAGTADFDALVVDERAADLLGPTVHASAEGVSGAAGVQLDAARLAGAAVTLETSGTAGDSLNLAYRLELPKLAALSRLAGQELCGSTTIAGTITGPRAAPVLSGQLSAESLRVADLAVASASGTFNARNLGAHPEGDLTLDLLAQAQRLSVATAYQRREDGTLALTGLKLTAPQGGVSGDVSLLPTGLLDEIGRASCR